MNAVWSFWSEPHFADGESRWCRDWHHWLAWGLSLYTARQHYPETCLVTDDLGARILIDKLQLPFVHVSTALSKIRRQDNDWWALGKLEAYRRQQTPFVHVDADVFLWKPLGPELEAADVFAQNPEPIMSGSCYRPEELERVVAGAANGWLPKEWKWYRRSTRYPRAECCGVFGGRRVDFINYYAQTAMKLVADPRNRRALEGLSEKPGHMILVEQYMLSACVEYYRGRTRSPYHGIEMRYVFDTLEDLARPESAAEKGFTHLAGGAKRNPRICRDLERRVQHSLPDYYDRCLRAAEREAGGSGPQ